MIKRSDLDKRAEFHCYFIVCLYLTFSDTSAVWIYIVYFCNVKTASSFGIKQPTYICQ